MVLIQRVINRTTSDLRELEDKNKNYNFDSNDEGITTSEGNHADDTHEKEDNNGDDRTIDHKSANGNNNTLSAAIIKIQHYIPQHLQLLFDVSKPFTLPYHLQYRADAVAKGVPSFHDHSIINDTDLKALFSQNSIEKNNWLSNFVTDNYLEIMRNKYSMENFKIKTITWKRFEKAIDVVPTKQIWKEGDSLWQQVIIFIPCNSFQSEHWFPLAVIPKKKQVVSLNSKAGDFVKPTIHDALLKMGSLLVALDESIDLSEWVFF